MGTLISTTGVVAEGTKLEEKTLGTDAQDDVGMESNLRTDEESRLVELMQALHRIARLQKEAANAQIDARQKMREVGFKRQAVLVCDGSFMREVQQLMTQGRFEGFQELSRLAAECQNARDGLGPLEQEGIEAEQRWEGQIWKLRQAEDNVYEEFEYEFRTAEAYSSPPTSAASSHYEPPLETESEKNKVESQQPATRYYQYAGSAVSSLSYTLGWDAETLPQWDAEMFQDITLLGLDKATKPLSETESRTWDSDTVIADIDLLPYAAEDVVGPPQLLPRRLYASIEVYPHLLTDFGSRRDRINKWLQHTTLVSRFEATLLRDQLALETPKTPSNWSQLVIAYWELDGAACVDFRNPEPSDSRSQQGTTHLTEQVLSTNPDSMELQNQQSENSYAKKRLSQSQNPDYSYVDSSSGGQGLESFMVPLREAPGPPLRTNSKGDRTGIHDKAGGEEKPSKVAR